MESPAVQQALIGRDDFSLTAAMIIIVTLVSVDIALSLVKRSSRKADLVLDGVPVLLYENGRLLDNKLHRGARR